MDTWSPWKLIESMESNGPKKHVDSYKAMGAVDISGNKVTPSSSVDAHGLNRAVHRNQWNTYKPLGIIHVASFYDFHGSSILS